MKKMTQRFILITAFLTTEISAGRVSDKLSAAALERTRHNVIYNGKYVKIPYPNGDVPANTGVCTDVVIRAYRQLGIDLQQRVHEDMKRHFSSYPSKRIWGAKAS